MCINKFSKKCLVSYFISNSSQSISFYLNSRWMLVEGGTSPSAQTGARLLKI